MRNARLEEAQLLLEALQVAEKHPFAPADFGEKAWIRLARLLCVPLEHFQIADPAATEIAELKEGG
jgi:hypothetical protein